jgi:transcriptional antiterminator NusG
MEIVKTDMKWYVVRTQNQREKSVAERIQKEAEKGTLIGKVGQVIIPIEKVITVKSGKKIQKEKVMLPGYIFLETNAVGELKYFLKSVKGTSGFLTERNGDIKSLSEAEVNKMTGRNKEVPVESLLSFEVDEEVIINDGPFSTMKATIDKIEDQKVTLSVSIFGRKTPLTLDIHQIDKKH